MKRKILFLLIFSFSVFLTGCSSNGSESSSTSAAGIFQTGTASWYGSDYNGLPTASGEPFDFKAFTAAHRSLAFGTMVEVTNKENGRRVTVKINDRGPKIENRIIDLSYAAALEIGMIQSGTAMVDLKIIN
ncbi:MAG: septal ring lytic transglycosylase RlpA family protein [Candidatus Riflebacteria bacterium]|nr:septal ring lytic transglycosylase RlpA family protein [Candidatus Riflebacteria bacterium]